MKNFKKFAIAFVFMLCFGLMLGGCAVTLDKPLDVNVNQNLTEEKTALKFSEVKTLLQQDLFVSWEGSKIATSWEEEGYRYAEYILEKDNKAESYRFFNNQCGTERYYVNGYCYEIDNSTYTKYLSEIQGLDYYVEILDYEDIISNLDLFYISNSYVKTVEGYDVIVELDSNLMHVKYDTWGLKGYKKINFVYHFDNNNNLIMLEFIMEDADSNFMMWQASNYTSEIQAPDNFNTNDYTLVA